MSWSGLDALTLNGWATRVNDFIRLTNNVGNQAGAAWSPTTIDPRGGLGYAGLTPHGARVRHLPERRRARRQRGCAGAGDGARLATANPGFPLHGAGPVHGWLDSSAGMVSVYVSQTAVKPALPLFTATTTPLGSAARIGFTGGTGGSVAQQDLLGRTLSNETLPGHQ